MNKVGASQDYINKVKKKYGKAIKFNKKTKKYEINKNTNDYKKAKRSTIKKAAIATAATIGTIAGAKIIKDKKNSKLQKVAIEKAGERFDKIYKRAQQAKSSGNLELYKKLTEIADRAYDDTYETMTKKKGLTTRQLRKLGAETMGIHHRPNMDRLY